MIHSSAITSMCMKQPNPKQALIDFWNTEVRYLMAHNPTTPDFNGTDTQHFNGHKVMPGPNCDPTLVAPLSNFDLDDLEQTHFIRFTDNITTEGADISTQQANYGVMTPAEADAFEKVLREQAKKLHSKAA